MNDREICERAGIDYDEAVRIADKAEAGDWSDYDFSRTEFRAPRPGEPTESVTIDIPEFEAEAMRRASEKHGLTTAEFFCRAIGRELILLGD